MSRDKHQIYLELIDEVRRSQAATARFDRAVATAVGINLTDMGCIDVLSRTGPLTAGQLAEQTGLSSGAMTTALDRLERAGLVRRARDQQDRRRVLVELTEEARRLDAYYAEHADEAQKLYRSHTAAQLELLLDFVRGSREFNERRAVEVERETRGG